MSNFWAQRLGTAPAPQQPVQSATQPWWSNPYMQAAPPVQQPQAAPQQPAPQPEQQGGWGSVAGSTAKAKSARLNTTCPECGGDHLFRPEGQPNAMEQCYGCGWNPRFSQMGGQGGLPSDATGPATPARQIASGGAGGVSNFSPGTIIAHV